MALAVAATVAIVEQRDDALRAAHRDLDHLGIAIAEQTTRSVQATELILDDIERDLVTENNASAEVFRSRLGTEKIHQQLARRAETLPQADAFMVIGADGVMVNSSRVWPVPDIELQDRDYYAHHRANSSVATFISRPVRNRGNGKWTIYLSRRVDTKAGEFAGLIMAALDLQYFTDFYRVVTEGTAMSVTMLRRDGAVLASYPSLSDPGDRMPQASPWYALAATGHGAYSGEGYIRSGNRIVAVRALDAYPLVIDTSIREEAALAPWRRMAMVTGICTATAILSVLLSLRALLQQVRKLEFSKLSLAAQNEQLGANQASMEQQAAELSASRARLAEQTAALETTLAHIDQGIAMISADGRFRVFNDRTTQLLGIPPELMDTHPTLDQVAGYQASQGEFLHGSGIKPSRYLPGNAIIHNRPHTYERTRPNGVVLEIQSLPLPGGGMVRTYTDITERRRSEEQVRQLAQFDSLTRLVNRRVFTERLEEAIQCAAAANGRVGLLYLDLDGFKRVNDTYGHWTGDVLLVELASRLLSCVRDHDTVARMGGDEFAVIQLLPNEPGDAERLAERLLAAVQAPIVTDAAQFTVRVSIGIALYPDHAASAGNLLREADVALYRAKAEGKGAWRMFDRGMDLRRTELYLLEQDLGRALPEQQFFVEYQPIVHTTTRAIVGYEALCRWRHPQRGLVPPADFIPIAESSGLILPIGRFVLETACAEAATWPGTIGICINLSPLQFTRIDLPVVIADVVRQTNLAPHRLTLEVTEGLLLEDTDHVLQTMATVRRMGVRFSLDDFGTAHSGLAYLRRFAFDALKIDRTFVQDAAEHRDAAAIVRAVLAIGAAFGLTVVAEGVETPEQLAMLRDMGCDLVQGYLTGRPGRPNHALPQVDAAN